MSMVLLDIKPGESRGPNMIPFTSDLDACDEMDGDSVAGGCRDRKSGGNSRNNSSTSVGSILSGSSRSAGSVEKKTQRSTDASLSPRGSHSDGAETDDGTANSSSNDSSSTASSSNRRSRQRRNSTTRRLSSSLKEPAQQLECQSYTTTHLEALRLRREAGKDRRAYSFNDVTSPPPPNKQLQGGNRTAEKMQWKPTLDVLDGSVTEAPDSAVSLESTGTFVDTRSPSGEEDSKKLDIIMPDLSLNDNNKTLPSNTSPSIPVVQDNIVKKAQSETESVGTNTTASSGDKMNSIAKSTSIASNMSSDTSKTIKSGNLEQHPLLSVAKKAVSSTIKQKNSSESGSSTSAKDITSDVTTAIKRNSSSSNSKSTPIKEPNQTMREYLINDLLNIDSRNQDGSATEDIDANMEEFLRIPSKLENLMIFSLAVCADSFLYAWAMLPLKFVWGIVCMICSVVRPRGVQIRFHRRHLYPMLQSVLIYFVYTQVLCPISIGKLYHWIRGQAMLKLYVLIAIVEVFDRLLCSFGQDAWDSLYWNTTKRPKHPRMFVSVSSSSA